mmetsp:Transcript_5739/g.19016  ORF Transcript_5739/g.19016 Transcript_5739/m.19016 type:complete len:353 (-) Transcript_5739:113-1171(-)
MRAHLPARRRGPVCAMVSEWRRGNRCSRCGRSYGAALPPAPPAPRRRASGGATGAWRGDGKQRDSCGIGRRALGWCRVDASRPRGARRGRVLGSDSRQVRLVRLLAPQGRLPGVRRTGGRVACGAAPPNLKAQVGLALRQVQGSRRGGRLPSKEALAVGGHTETCAHLRPSVAGIAQETQPGRQVDLVYRCPPRRRPSHFGLVRQEAVLVRPGSLSFALQDASLALACGARRRLPLEASSLRLLLRRCFGARLPRASVLRPAHQCSHRAGQDPQGSPYLIPSWRDGHCLASDAAVALLCRRRWDHFTPHGLTTGGQVVVNRAIVVMIVDGICEVPMLCTEVVRISGTGFAAV